ncbi:hypothetical protein HDU93_007066, partial [Gonapodya sp. JEL0774]
MHLASQTVNLAIASEKFSLTDQDNLLPFLNATLWKFQIADNVTLFGTTNFAPLNTLALGRNLVFKSAGYSLGLIISTVNYTCNRFCPVNSTNGQLVFYGLDPDTLNVQSRIIGVPDPTKPGNLTKDVPVITGPQVYGDEILQSLYLGIFNRNGVQIGWSFLGYSVQKFCAMLDEVKSSTTPNTMFYVISPMREVLAISGLGNSTVQVQTLRKIIDPTYGIFGLKTIFDYDSDSFPLLNLSASALLEYSGGNLLSTSLDKSWHTEAYMFSVKTKDVYGYRYIVVTAAPLEDYLGDTIYLADNLKKEGIRAMIVVIASAVAVVSVMSLVAVLFVWIFIAKPLNDILSTIRKAIKFDFTDIREGRVKTRISIVNEIYQLQDNFMEMVTIFANALKQHKSLLGPSNKPKASNGESGLEAKTSRVGRRES